MAAVAGKKEYYNLLLRLFFVCNICNILDNQYYTPYNIDYQIARRDSMIFQTGAALLDAIVLAVVSKEEEGTYGYKITQEVRSTIEVSESTLYPVLRRLQKNRCLEVYDVECAGRNRRYYKITDAGRAQLLLYRREWADYSSKISLLFSGEEIK